MTPCHYGLPAADPADVWRRKTCCSAACREHAMAALRGGCGAVSQSGLVKCGVDWFPMQVVGVATTGPSADFGLTRPGPRRASSGWLETPTT